jgi:glycosyltransferase involved in cell wall biosynthesis
MDSKLTIILPSRNETFLTKTIQDLLAKAKGDIEIIAVLDGYWPSPHETKYWKSPAMIHDPRVAYLHKGAAEGMRAAINSAAEIAKGKYIMKLDAHCMVGEGFDEILKADCEENWVVIPRRKRLDAEKWDIQDVGKPDIDYEFLSYPYWKPEEVGIHGTIWTQRINERKDNPEYDIDENPTFQGSCWFMHKKFFKEVLEGMQEEGYGTFIGEPQEISMKTWLADGKLMVNKKTWYAHLHKGKTYGRGYTMNKRELIAGNAYSVDYWMNDKWPKAKHTMEWFVNEKFPDMPTWPKNWKEECIKLGLIHA